MKKDNWELVLQLTYDSLTKEDILKLLKEVKEVYDIVNPDTPYKEHSIAIAKSVANNRAISYKQWRALNVFVWKNTRPEANYKTF